MDMDAVVQGSVSVFQQSLAQLCQNAEDEALSPDGFSGFLQGLRRVLAEVGRVCVRTYLEAQEVQDATLMQSGVLKRYKADQVKLLMTHFGEIPLRRRVYQADNGGPLTVPLDEAAGIRGLSATRDLRESMLYCMAHLTADESHDMMAKLAPFAPSPTAIKNLVEASGTLLEAHHDDLLSVVRAQEGVPESTRVLVASMDGANVLLNELGPQKGRPAERPGLEPSEASSYRNAMVGSISFYGEVPHDHDCPTRLSSRYVAQMPEEGFVTFKERFLRELDQQERSLGPEVVKVLLCDGQRSLWTFAKESKRFASYRWLLDFHHTCEHLSLAAEAAFRIPDDAKAYYNRWRAKLLKEEDAVAGLLRSLRRYRQQTTAVHRQDQLDAQITFFERNEALMTYAAFRQQGLPIGSGPVEAACKVLVKQRLCRSGMRWSRTGGQHVLAHRTVIKSKRWDLLWPQLARVQESAYAA